MLRRFFLKNTLASSVSIFIAPGQVGTVQPLVNWALKERPTELVAGFLNPPDSVKPTTLWQWMNGCVTKEGITYDLESFKQAGIGHVQQFLVGGSEADITDPTIQILNPKWRDLMKFAVEECARLGLTFGTHNCPGWSSSGGPWVRVEQSMQKVVFSSKFIAGPLLFEGLLEPPKVDPKWNYYRDIAVLALPKNGSPSSEQVVDLTTMMDTGGRLRWNVPAGEWTILRFGHTTTGQLNGTAPNSGQGLEVDKMSRSALDAYWAGFPAILLDDAGAQAGKAFKRFEIDSYEAGHQDWTPAMREEFTKRRGYDPLPWLPVLAKQTIGSSELTKRFRQDWTTTISELFADNYYGYMTELVHHTPGLELVIEPYGTGHAPFDRTAISGLGDTLMCEFWWGPTTWGWDSIMPVASSVHGWGKRVVAAEAFTGQPQYAWRVDPYALKAPGDRAFCAGVNSFYLHASAHQPWPQVKPGMTMGWWGTNFGPGQTWWEHGGPEWLTYVTRCQYLLQQGLFAADIAYLQIHQAKDPVVPTGYKGDIFAESQLAHVQVKNGHLVLPDGMHYQVLVLPDQTTMTPQVATKIRQLVQAGATIVGPKPVASPSLENYPVCDTQVAAIGNEVWGTADGKTVRKHSYGNGRVFWGMHVDEVLTKLAIEPDVTFPSATDQQAPLLWTHRQLAETDIYFLSNQEETHRQVIVSFRITNKLPQLWHADTGTMETAPQWRQQPHRTDVTIDLGPCGSVFVVFQKPANRFDSVVAVRHNGKVLSNQESAAWRVVGSAYQLTTTEAGTFQASMASGKTRTITIPHVPKPLQLTGPWTLRFPPNWGAPESITLPSLISWAEHPDKGVKYFSGTATYQRSFTIPTGLVSKPYKLILDMGTVKHIASVSVNGKLVGVLWKPPFRIEVTNALRAGENKLEIKVTNLWPNRMIGDEQEPDDNEWGPVRTFTYVNPAVPIGRNLQQAPNWLKEAKQRPSKGRYSFTTMDVFNADSSLLPSGLLGPVRLDIAIEKAFAG